MTAGYGGAYRATVVDDVDPMQDHRLQVVVPDVYGDAPAWAAASLPARSAWKLPSVGDVVSVTFEHGDTDYPVWALAERTEDSRAMHGYVGEYRAVVVATDDPMQNHRLQVTVPEVDPQPFWATPKMTDVDQVETPEVGQQVWIEYDHGDPEHPRWVGLA